MCDIVDPGTNWIYVKSAGPPHFLASIKMADRDVLGQYLELYPGASPIQVVFASKGGGVRGSVEGCGGGTIVLVPQEKALQNSQFVQTAKCGEGGRFEAVNVP